MKRDAIAIRLQDNVATAIRNLKAGQTAVVGRGEEILQITLEQDILYGHKLAIHPIDRGQDVIKYASVIGRATCAIARGAHVHVHNVESLRGRGDLDRKTEK